MVRPILKPVYFVDQRVYEQARKWADILEISFSEFVSRVVEKENNRLAKIRLKTKTEEKEVAR